MAVLKKIKFGTGNATPIAQTVVTAASKSVLSVNGTNTGLDDDANPSYAVDLNISGDGTLVKDTTGQQAVLKVGTVPAAQVSVAAGGHNASAEPADVKTFVGNDVEEVLLELNEKINQTGNLARRYTVVDDTANVQDLPTNVAKRYRLQETIGSQSPTLVGANIDIPKDSSLKEVYLGASTDTINATTGEITKNTVTDPQSMNFAYQLADGTYKLVKIDVSKFLTESEFGDGLEVSNAGVVSVNAGNGLGFDSSDPKKVQVVIDSASEKDGENADFLTVGAGGVKIQGIKAEIDRKIAALDVTTDATVSGQYVAAIQETDGIVSVKTRANVSEAVLNNYAKGTAPASLDIAATDTINQALAKLEHQVDAAKAAATTKVVEGTDAGNNMTITSATSETDGSVTYTVNLTDVASKAALDAEIIARKTVDGQSGQTYAANSEKPYINNATSLNDADVKLAEGLSAEVTRAKSAETSIDAAIGLTKGTDNETRTYSNTGEYIGKGETTNTVTSDIKALDTKLKEVADGLAAVQYKVNGTTLEFFGISEK